MMIDLDNVVTVAEIAERLDQPIKTVQRWIERRPANDFPTSIKTVHNLTRLYDFTEVSVWFEGHKQKWGAYYATR